MSDLLELLYDETRWVGSDRSTKIAAARRLENLIPSYFQFSGIQSYECNEISRDIASFHFIPFLTSETPACPAAARFSLIPGRLESSESGGGSLRPPMLAAQTTVTWSAWMAILPFEKSLGLPLSELLQQFSPSDSTVERFLQGFRGTLPKPAESWDALLKLYEEATGESSSDELASFGPPRSMLEPVRYLSLFDVIQFIEALPLPLRLPSIAEWKFIARAGSSGAYCFGADLSLRKDYCNSLQPLDELFKMRSLDPLMAAAKPQIVASLKPNAFGLFDVHGNVLELVSGQLQSASTSVYCPLVGRQGAAGGCAWSSVDRCKIDDIVTIEPFLRHCSTGLRLVASLSELSPGLRFAAGDAPTLLDE